MSPPAFLIKRALSPALILHEGKEDKQRLLQIAGLGTVAGGTGMSLAAAEALRLVHSPEAEEIWQAGKNIAQTMPLKETLGGERIGGISSRKMYGLPETQLRGPEAERLIAEANRRYMLGASAFSRKNVAFGLGPQLADVVLAGEHLVDNPWLQEQLESPTGVAGRVVKRIANRPNKKSGLPFNASLKHYRAYQHADTDPYEQLNHLIEEERLARRKTLGDQLEAERAQRLRKHLVDRGVDPAKADAFVGSTQYTWKRHPARNVPEPVPVPAELSQAINWEHPAVFETLNKRYNIREAQSLYDGLLANGVKQNEALAQTFAKFPRFSNFLRTNVAGAALTYSRLIGMGRKFSPPALAASAGLAAAGIGLLRRRQRLQESKEAAFTAGHSVIK